MVGGVPRAKVGRASAKRRQPTTEAPIQAYGTKLCAKLGGITIRQHKGRGVTAGWPDCLHIVPVYDEPGEDSYANPVGAVAFWIEYKAPGKSSSPIQKLRQRALCALDQKVFTCDSYDEVDNAFIVMGVMDDPYVRSR